MKNIKRLCVALAVLMILCSIFTLTAMATEVPENAVSESDKLPMNLGDPNVEKLPFDKRIEYAVQGTVTGMMMVFGVLGLLTLILYGSKYVFYDLPKTRERARDSENAGSIIPAEPTKIVTPSPNTPVQAEESVAASAAQDDGELAAVITAAIAAMIEGGDYKNEFVGGFRVVSFKRK